ncbi:MAG: ubiquinone/menaquinone biosynthesis C-methylase UbiE [Alphaproteobacteria bacterium]|jgi:ubiquinone/menaquinone biosynthesis C-methylase UbiE
MITVEKIREHELNKVLETYGEYIKNKDLLEIGSGKGIYLEKFKSICQSAIGVDIKDGSCATQNVDGVQYYDGHTLPFEDNSFDVIFSSNVLEHIPHLSELEIEFNRVLKDDGVLIHVLPNSIWRIYTLLMHYIALPHSVFLFILRRVCAKLKPSVKVPGSESPQLFKHTTKSLVMDTLIARRHGETGNRITEIYYFSNKYWAKHFKNSHWKNIETKDTGIFYSNYSLGLCLKTHVKLSKILGSATTIYKMHK